MVAGGSIVTQKGGQAGHGLDWLVYCFDPETHDKADEEYRLCYVSNWNYLGAPQIYLQIRTSSHKIRAPSHRSAHHLTDPCVVSLIRASSH